MPARIHKIRHDDETRAKIQTAHIMRRLMSHINGEIELSPTQISAANILLRKVLPDLAAVDVTADVRHEYVAEMPPHTDTVEEWQKVHGSGQTVQ